MLARGKTQVATAAALGVTDRTIRNWAKAKSFQGALERARERVAREAAKERRRRERNARRRFRRQHPGLWADLQARRPELQVPVRLAARPPSEPEQQPSGPGRLKRIRHGYNW